MKSIHIREDIHTALRMKSIHTNKNLQDLVNELLTDALYTNTTTTQGK